MIVEDQAETLAFLQDPASYAGSAAAVERIDTHVSAVFLAGSFAYKLKRAVRFDYLDFSTAERRAEACAAELALNRRTAPALYVDLWSIRRGTSGHLQFGGKGALVDSVVVMRRFDQDCLLDRLAARDALSPGLMRELADRIAGFHRAAEVDRGFGGLAGLAAIIEGNDANLMLAGPATLDPKQIRRLTAGDRAELARHGDLVERRRREGMVRLCHGDLHLRNICLIDGVPTLFDCVEFNRAIACVDVLYDLSFLLMDLLHRGRGDLANIVFNRYFDRESEVEGAAALPLFLSMHAAIRAHVGAASLAAAPGATPGADESRIADARAYLDLAIDLLRVGAPCLIAIGGFSGTGKSTLAQGLAPAIGGAPGARLLRSDVLRKRHMGVLPETRLPPAAYGAEVSAAVYAALGREAEQLLRCGWSVIVDAAFLRPEERAAVEALARNAGARFRGLWLEASPELLTARIEARRGDASDATAAVLRRQLERDPGPVAWARLNAAAEASRVRDSAAKIIG
jgi:aminoglycoside phosphotransferase family enzyme/predicted kinase